MRNFALILIVIFLQVSNCLGAIELVKGGKPSSIIVVPQGTSALVGDPISREEYDLRKIMGEKIENKVDGQIDPVLWYTSTVDSISVAASELQKYIEKSTGAKLEIVTEDKLGESSPANKIFIGPLSNQCPRLTQPVSSRKAM